LDTIAKKKREVQIEVIGGNAEGVTGSCSKISFFGRTALFELGMIQDNNTILENYRANSKLISKIKPKEIELVFIGHCHCDHIGLIPALFARGNKDIKIIVPKGSTGILKEMWLDSAYINQRDFDQLNSKFNTTSYTPLYTNDEVNMALSHIIEIDVGNIVEIDKEINIRYIPAGHVLCSCQMELFIKGGSHTRKILFTSDLGNQMIEDRKVFVEPLQKSVNTQVVIGEATYGRRAGSMSKKDIELDRKKMKSVIEQYCVDNGKRVLIPSFAYDRTPFILWELYCLYGNDKTFDIPVLVDSPLANRLLDCYSLILTGEAKDKFDEMMSWKNIKRIITPEDSRAAVADKGAKLILSSSGMLCAGRSIKWTQSILPNEDDAILFVGFAGSDTLAGKIKNEKTKKTINIGGKPCKNKCQIIDLHSFSSHMQRNDLINYYKSINCEKIYLVHGDTSARLELKEDLEKAISDCLKSTRVIITNKGTKISL